MSANWIPSSLPDLDGELEQAKVAGLPSALAAKADDAAVNKLAVAQTIVAAKTHTALITLDYSTRAPDQINSLRLWGDTVNPPFGIGHSSQYSGVPAYGNNFAVSIGHGVDGQAGVYDPANPTSSLVFESNYFSDVFNPPQLSTETYFSNIWYDGTVIRPVFINVSKVSKTAIVGLVCSRFSIAREDQAAMLNFSWDSVATHIGFSLTYPGVNSGPFFSLAATATTDSFALGRVTSVGTNVFLNSGASGQIDQSWQLNGVTKFKQSLNSASGGTFTLYDPTGVGVEAAWVSAGKSYRQSTARTMIGYVIPAAATAQFEVVPVDPATIGLFVLGASGQTANYMQVQAWAGAKYLVVDGSGKVAIGDGTPISKVLSTTATLNFPSTAAQTSSDLTVSVTGAAAGDAVTITPPATVDANACFTGRVSAADTVSVRFNNYSVSPIDPASGLYRVTVTKF